MTIKRAQLIGFIAASIAGTLLHFVFGWSGGLAPIGAVSPVNESVWEHLKLLAMPMLVYGVFEYFMYGKSLKNFIAARFLSIVLGMAVIVSGYYTYSGIIGHDVMWVNIMLLELALLIAYCYSGKRLGSKALSSPAARGWSLLGIAALLAVFVIFTYCPPRIDLFVDPQTAGYGLPR